MKNIASFIIAAAFSFTSPFLAGDIFLCACAAPSEACASRSMQESDALPAIIRRDTVSTRLSQDLIPWLIVEEHSTDLFDANGKKIFYGSYPTLRVKDLSHVQLSRALAAWSTKQAADFAHISASMGEAQSKNLAQGMHKAETCFFCTVIETWGRTDEQMLSFDLRRTSYDSMTDPMSSGTAVTLDVQTGRNIALNELISDREVLIAALSTAFRRQYPASSDASIMEEAAAKLATLHREDRGFRWYMGQAGELVFIYGAFSLLPRFEPYTITLTRSEAPEVFSNAYPLE